MFDQKKLCSNCPFRKGQGENFKLGRARIEEIARSTAFQCHKTLIQMFVAKKSPAPQQCAGLMSVLFAERRPNQIMRVAVAFGELDPNDFPVDGAYSTLEEAIADHCE